jgi:Golgi SNAP receptor complex protein 2
MRDNKRFALNALDFLMYLLILRSNQLRNELLSTASASTSSHYSPASTTLRRANTSSSPNLNHAATSPIHESPFASNPLYQPNHPPSSREDFALREHSFLQESENSIDQYIAQGRAVLENLVEQRGMLKGTKRKLLDAANTLGLSRETIGWVERRT